MAKAHDGTAGCGGTEPLEESRLRLELFRALRSGLRPHNRSGGYAADSIGRYAWTQTALAVRRAAPGSSDAG